MSNLLYDSLFGRHVGDDKPFLTFADGSQIGYDGFLCMASRFANTLRAAGLTAGVWPETCDRSRWRSYFTQKGW